MEIRFLEYLKKIETGDYKPAIKICWLNPDETVQLSFTEKIYDISGTINVNYQTGTRRTCNLTINNNTKEEFPINCVNIWFGQKFQVWAGVYLDDETPYYISQGIFYIQNPSEVYDPTTKTITIQGVDKWAFLDGSLFGYLTGIYSQSFNTDLKQSSVALLKSSKFSNSLEIANKEIDQIDPKTVMFSPVFNTQKREKQQYYGKKGDVIYQNDEGKLYILNLQKVDTDGNCNYSFSEVREDKDGEYKIVENSIINPGENDKFYTKEESVLFSPYTIKLDENSTLAKYYEEVATILAANVYYNNFGYLYFEPMDTTVDDLSNDNKVIAWNFNNNQKTFLGVTMDNDFTSFYNDIIVLGKVVNGKQAKARIQNQDISSDTNIFRIGIKTKPPYKDEMYYTDGLCLDLAKYYARTEMAKNKKVTIKSLPLYHLDVNQLVTLTIPEKNYFNEKFLVNSFSIPLGNGTMSISCNNIKNFSQWTEASIYD